MKNKYILGFLTTLLISVSLIGCASDNSSVTLVSGKSTKKPAVIIQNKIETTEDAGVEAVNEEQEEVYKEPDITNLTEGEDYIINKSGKILLLAGESDSTDDTEIGANVSTGYEGMNEYEVYSEGSISVLSSGATESQLNGVQSRIDSLPDTMKSIIGSWKVVVTTDDIASLVGHSGQKYCGATIVGSGVTYIEANESKFSKNVVHELAHAMDYKMGYTSTSQEFTEIYEAEKDSLKLTQYVSTDNHYKENVKEYFADAVQEYVANSGSLSNSAPRTYEYIKKLLG